MIGTFMNRKEKKGRVPLPINFMSLDEITRSKLN